MFCNHCGSQLPDGVGFCPNCGAKLEVPEVPATTEPVVAKPVPEKKVKNISPILIIIPIVILIIIAIAAIIFLLLGMKETSGNTGNLGNGSSNSASNTSNNNASNSANNDINNSSNNNNGDIININSSSKGMVICEYQTFSNSDGEIFKCDDLETFERCGDLSQYIYTVYSDQYLYYIDGDLEPKIIGENVSAFKISNSGEYIAYVISEDFWRTERDLYLLHIESGKTTLIDSGVGNIALSPNGETMVYNIYTEDGSDSKYYVNGFYLEKTELLEGSYLPLTVSDEGKMICFLDEDQSLYVYKDNDAKLLNSGINTNWFNSSLTEILYDNDNSTFYYTVGMDEPKKINDNTYDYLDKIYGTYEKSLYQLDDMSIYNTYILNKDTLKGTMYSSDGLWWLNDTADAVLVAEYRYDVYLSEDGNSMVYESEGNVYIMDEINNELESRCVFEENAKYIIANKDLTHIYIRTADKIYYLKDNNELEIVYEGTEMGYFMAYSEKLNNLFFTVKDELYSVGTDSESLEKIDSDVINIYKFGFGIVYLVQKGEDYSYYYLYDKDAEKIYGY